ILLSCSLLNDTSTTVIYTLSLHDALPIWLGDEPLADPRRRHEHDAGGRQLRVLALARVAARGLEVGDQTRGHVRGEQLLDHPSRSEEHTSELQSRENLVCRLLLEKKKSNL